MKHYYVEKDGFYKKSCKPHVIYGIVAAAFICLGALFIFSSVKSNSVRRELDTVRGQLIAATDTNRELGEQLEDCRGRLEQCHYIIEELGDSTGRSIETVRDCIELIEEERYLIACLSYYIDGGNSDELYSRIDNWLQDEGIE